jgi:hypothetical protein
MKELGINAIRLRQPRAQLRRERPPHRPHSRPRGDRRGPCNPCSFRSPFRYNQYNHSERNCQ